MYLEKILGQTLSEDKMRVILIKHNGVLIGYASCQFKSEHVRLKDTKYYDHSIGYMTMCAILPEYHSFGVYRFLNYVRLLYLINKKSERIFVRTQNAKVFMGIQSMLENFKQYGLIDSYELEFAKYEKALFSGIITENFGVKEIKNIPKEFDSINAENGDIGLYLWKIKI